MAGEERRRLVAALDDLRHVMRLSDQQEPRIIKLGRRPADHRQPLKAEIPRTVQRRQVPEARHHRQPRTPRGPTTRAHQLADLSARGAAAILGMSFTPTERHGEGRIVELLVELLHRGHGDRILLSQDVCHNSQLRRYDGNGYTYLQTTFLPRLREAGVTDAEIDRMTIANPRRILTIG